MPSPSRPPLLEARLDGGFLVTAAAAKRARAALRGALRGLSGPVQLSALAGSLGIDPKVLAGAGVPAPMDAVLADIDRGIAAGELLVPTTDLETLLGRPATDLRQAVKEALG